MQSRKPIAKSFKKEVKKILKELRINTYLPPPATQEDMVTISKHDLEVYELMGDVATQHLNGFPNHLKRFRELLKPPEKVLFDLLCINMRYYYK
jgi:prophage antirepressor-like protein